MALFLVSYNLNNFPADAEIYQPLAAELRDSGGVQPMDSVWLLKSTFTAQQIRDRLQRHIFGNDLLLVVQIGPDWATHISDHSVLTWFGSEL